MAVRGQTPARRAIDWVAVERSPQFQELVRPFDELFVRSETVLGAEEATVEPARPRSRAPIKA